MERCSHYWLPTLRGNAMNKIVIAFAALLASAVFVPAAHADCSDPDDASDVADCVRSIVKVPALRPTLPPAAMPSAAMKERCDADDADDLKECMQGLKVPGVSRLAPPDARPAAEIPLERQLPDKAEAAPTAATVASSEKPAKLAEPDEAALCQRYFAGVGQMVLVPCRD
jgi:hypothetical protein